MRGFDFQEALRGEYCDICKKTIYVDIWGHVAMHRRALQRKEDERAMRENSERFTERLREARNL